MTMPATYISNRGGTGRSVCLVDGCTKTVFGRGLCPMHYERARKTGNLPVLAQRELICRVDGCTRESAEGSRLCSLHKQRKRRTGEFGPVEPLRRNPGEIRPTGHGYLIVLDPDHPLTHDRVDKRVLVHRRVLYDIIGPGPHPCHWCERPVDWTYGLSDDALVVDHLDFDGMNNAPTNLVPSCHPCNSTRKP